MSLPVENVQTYPRPPALEPVVQDLSIVFAGERIAQTRDGFRVLETHHAPTYYLPPAAFAPGVLLPARGQSFCEWKGVARYFDIVAGSQSAPRAAWGYDAPTARFKPIAGFIAVYAEPMDACFVGEERVLPQPGSFYGGWVTSNLTGTVKGGPGTLGW
ncbi:MAG: DUF427 domain-containing protein [Pseudomonadota bacterium]